jgi:hypothetical protein
VLLLCSSYDERLKICDARLGYVLRDDALILTVCCLPIWECTVQLVLVIFDFKLVYPNDQIGDRKDIEQVTNGVFGS